MALKVEATIRFVESSGERAIIAKLGNLTAALDGKAGTRNCTESLIRIARPNSNIP
jgi:carbamate kinase